MEDAALRGAARTIADCPAPTLYVENNHYPDASLADRHCPPDAYVAFHHTFTYAAGFGFPTSYDAWALGRDLDRQTSRNMLCVAPWAAARLATAADEPLVFLELVPGYEAAAEAAFGADLVARLTRPVDAAALYPHRGADWRGELGAG